MRLIGGRYRLLDELGHGGHGTVWRAEDQLTRREVALKRLRAEYALDGRLRRRLRREARAVARLEHPHIVRLYDMGEDEDQSPYLAMELVRGRSLREVARARPDLEHIVEYVDQILAALAFAHARGVVHRDLKPENVIVTADADGRELVKLLDFGFAWVEDDSDDQLTAVARDVFGSPTYMAPEQATGDYEAVGPATDLYAVGIVLWELLTGQPPFSGSSGTEIVVQHVTAPLPTLSPLPHLDVPGEVAAVLAQALEKEPGRRFGSAGEMRRALTAVFEDDDSTMTVVNVAPPFGERTPAEGTMRPPELVEAAPEGRLRAPSVASESLPLVGREPQQRWLWDAVLAVCGDGVPRTMLLEGPPGAGKTRLCAWLYRALVEGGWMTPLAGRCHPMPFGGGLRDAVLGALGLSGRTPVDRRREAVAGALRELDRDGRVDADALAGWLWPGPTRTTPGHGAWLVDRLLRLLAARRPVLLWVDDLHHASHAQLTVLEHLVVSLALRPAPVLLLGTRRTDAGAEALSALLTRRAAHLDVQGLAPLEDAAVRALLQHALPLEAGAAEALVTVAAGNPLHALEALQLALDRGALRPHAGAWRRAPRAEAPPAALRDVLRGRVAGALGAGAELAALAEPLALLGDGFSFAHAEQLARGPDFDAVRLETGLDALVRVGVLVDADGDAFAFRNEPLREALAERAQARPDAATLHARVAEVLEDAAGGVGPWAMAAAARHLRAAGRRRQATERLLDAARFAGRLQVPSAAADLYAEAEAWLAEATDAEAVAARLRCRLGRAEAAARAGDTAAAATLLEGFAAVSEALGAHALCLRAELALETGLPAGELLDAAERLLDAAGDADLRARLAWLRARVALLANDAAAARPHLALARAGDQPTRAAATRALAELAWRAGDRHGAARSLAEAVDLAERAGDDRLVGPVAWRDADLQRQVGRTELAIERYEQAALAFELAGNPSGVARALRGLGDAQRTLHRPEARRSYQRAAQIFEALGDGFQLAICFTQLGRLAFDQNEAHEAERWFLRALRGLERFDDPVRTGVIHAFLARIAHRRRDVAARERRLQAALRHDAARPLRVQEWPRILEEIADGLAAEGDVRRAVQLLQRALDSWSALRQAEHAARCRGRLAVLRGEQGVP